MNCRLAQLAFAEPGEYDGGHDQDMEETAEHAANHGEVPLQRRRPTTQNPEESRRMRMAILRQHEQKVTAAAAGRYLRWTLKSLVFAALQPLCQGGTIPARVVEMRWFLC